MKKLLTILLTWMLLFFCASAAFAEQTNDPLPRDLSAYGFLAAENLGFLYLVMDASYVSSAPSISVTLLEKATQSETKPHQIENLQAERASFLRDNETVEQFVLLVPLKDTDGLVNIRGLILPAGSFSTADGSNSPELRLKEAEHLRLTEDNTYTSKLLRETRNLPGSTDIPVGVGDTLHLHYSCDLPYSIYFDDTLVADAPGGGTVQTDCASGANGKHQLTLRVFGNIADTCTFEVQDQLKIYSSTIFDYLGYGGLLLAAPLIAPVAFFIFPPVGIAAAVAPGALLDVDFGEIFKFIFSVFHLI